MVGSKSSHDGSAAPAAPRTATDTASPSTSVNAAGSSVTEKRSSSVPAKLAGSVIAGASLIASIVSITRAVSVRPVVSTMR